MVLLLGFVFLLLVFDAVQVAVLIGTDRPISAAVAERASLLAVVAAADRPEPLGVAGAIGIAVGAGQYDLTARLSNPNEGWLAGTVTAHFRVGSESSPPLSTFVLSHGDQGLGERLLLLPRVKLSAPADVELVVDTVDWKRVSVRDRLSGPPLVVTTATLASTTLSGGAPGSTATIGLKNQSDYGYRTVSVTVAVERGGAALALARVSAINVKSGSTVTVNPAWAQRFPPDATLRVDAAVNPFDLTNRLPLSE